ncbi:MAG: hypothetical protein LBS08_01470 [Candidatus Symbiothrix sp.]|jgi:hypothetical protein|nr:hypothetical protein [Candidatus Symbiothrix sp.]
MKQIKIWLCVVLLSGTYNAFAQQSPQNGSEQIALSIWIPDNTGLTADAQRMLQNKVSQIASKQGIAADPGYSRFVFTANVVIVEKYITPTAPPKQAYKIDVTFYIGDGIEGKAFSSCNTAITGIGDNETKAFMDALKNIRVLNPDYKKFIELGKAKIIAYYNEKCDAIIRESQTLSAAQQYDEAIYKLMSVPEECKECRMKVMDAADAVYQQKIDRECKTILAEANALWNAEQNVEGAQKAGQTLVRIDPNANCFNEALALSKKISERIKQLDERAWNVQQEKLAFQREMTQKEFDFRVNSSEREDELERERIKAYRDVQKTYAENQPAVQYVSLW